MLIKPRIAQHGVRAETELGPQTVLSTLAQALPKRLPYWHRFLGGRGRSWRPVNYHL